MYNEETGLSPISERNAFFSHGLVPVGTTVAGNGDAAALRKEFRDAGLFAAWQSETGNGDARPCDVPLDVVCGRLDAHRAAEAAAKADLEATQASLATPVKPEPAVVTTVEDLPPTPEEHAARLKAERIARSEALAAQALAEIAARKAAQAAARPAPVAKPVAAAPAPKVERTPGTGECWCMNGRCKRHVIALADAFVPQDDVLIDAFGRDVAPTIEQLATLATCRAVFRDNTGLRWYRLLETHEQIVRLVAARVEREATEAERTIGGKIGRMAADAIRRGSAKPVATSAPTPAKARGETKLEGLAALALWKKK